MIDLPSWQLSIKDNITVFEFNISFFISFSFKFLNILTASLNVFLLYINVILTLFSKLLIKTLYNFRHFLEIY